MAPTASASTSLKEYLKKYESNTEEEKKKKKTRKKTKTVSTGVLVVDEDPVWQKPVKLDEDEDNDSSDEKPLVDEDIEVKRMRRLEQLRARHSYNQISEDGSGWVSVSDVAKHSTSADQSSDMSPRHVGVARYDTPSPEIGLKPSDSGREDIDLSPPQQRRRCNDSSSPGPRLKPLGAVGEDTDLSPPRQRRRRNDSPLPEPEGTELSPLRPRGRHSGSLAQLESKSLDVEDLSPPRQRRGRYDSPSPERNIKAPDSSQNEDISPPRRRGRTHGSSPAVPRKNSSVSGEKESGAHDLSPLRKRKEQRIEADLSPPRRRKELQTEADLSPPRKRKEQQTVADISSPRKKKEQQKTGLITGKDVREEITKTKKDEWSRFNEMDPSASGRGAEPVYRIRGERVSKEEYLKLTKKEEKRKEEKKLEWGKGLAQKREAEAKFLELELEKNKPFARSRDDPELDRMMKERLRWGDPMAHLVKKKQHDRDLPNLGEDEKMKESGFIVPQEIPSHSWMKRGLDFEPNRYGIKPGRHWDGVNRSNGYEKQLFKRMNEKRATEREAYLWSVSDM